ncbi:transposase, truncated [Pseudomonas sp. BAY1663]|jgi:transposase|nr:transposase, truncated [Pseudomonas sp. BAY1663]
MMRLLGILPACTVVMEACAGAHFMARQLTALGHQVKLISPQFVRPFVKGNKGSPQNSEKIVR